MILWDVESFNWLVNDSFNRRKKNMCRTRVGKAMGYEKSASIFTTHPGNNGGAYYIHNEELDSLIQALTTYRDNLPKPCVHAELIKQYAEDCQKYEKPWELWQFYEEGEAYWVYFDQHPRWEEDTLYRRIGAKK